MAEAPPTWADFSLCLAERRDRQAANEQISCARTWLRQLKWLARHGVFSERPDGVEKALARARSLGFGDVRTLEDLRCACWAMLARPPYEHPVDHPWWQAGMVYK